MIDHSVADDDTVHERGVIFGKLREHLLIARAIGRQVMNGLGAVQIGDHDVVGIEGAVGVQVLPIIGVQLPLGDVVRAQRSISPNTISNEPSTALTSARRWPRFIQSIAARCGKPGALILQR